MAKDPAFLFYPNDWDGGTKLFTRAQKGAYIDLLICQFHSGHMTSHDIGHVLGQVDYDNMWESKLKYKFKQDNEGKFFNQKLEDEQLKRKNWCDSRRNNKEGYNQYSGHMTSHTEAHMVNENVIVNEVKNKIKKPLNTIAGFFYQEYEKTFGEKYVANFGKDGAILKEILTVLPETRVKELIVSFFQSKDEFIQKTGYTVGVFKSQINKLKNPTTALDDIYAKAGIRKE